MLHLFKKLGRVTGNYPNPRGVNKGSVGKGRPVADVEKTTKGIANVTGRKGPQEGPHIGSKPSSPNGLHEQNVSAQPDQGRKSVQTLSPQPQPNGPDIASSAALTSLRSQEFEPGLRLERRNELVPVPLDIDYPEIQALMGYTGAILTSADGPIPTTENERLFSAYLEDGRFLVAKGHQSTPAVAQTWRAVTHGEFRERFSGAFFVSLDIIRRIYEANAQRTSAARGASERIPMQQRFLEIVSKATRMKASDIHLRVGRSEAELHFTIDGLLRHIEQVPAGMAHGICASAFAMADASDPTYNPYEHQGARISVQKSAGLLPPGIQSLRLQFNALINGGREMVVRLLKESSDAGEGGDVDTLGYTRQHVVAIQRIRRKPFGVNIISGPTGSGKSTTLHRALTALIKETDYRKKLITIEDPPEYIYPHASQLPVTNAQSAEERKEKFTQAINAAMRSAPHIIMIGEIRDNASAALAMEAGMTGHQVWASLHANDAASILDRLKDKEVEEYKLMDHTLMTGLIGQRLIRRLCIHCAVPLARALSCDAPERHSLNEGLIERLKIATKGKTDGIRVVHPDGCDKCDGGNNGREVVAEVIAPDQKFMALYRDGDKDGAIKHWIDEMDGMTIQEHAITKMMRGLCAPWDVEDRTGDFGEFNPDRLERVLAMSGE